MSYLCALLYENRNIYLANMRSLIAALCLSLAAGTVANAQTTTTTTDKTEKKNTSKPSRDHFLIQLSHDRWTGTPDSIGLRNAGRGVGMYLMYDFPIKKTNFSFGAGVGARWSNIYFSAERMNLDSRSGSILFENTDPDIFKGQKFTTTMLEAPLELRYFANKENRNRGFKFAIGAKVGFMGVGGAYFKERESISGKFVNHKTVSKRYNQQWRLTPTARIGWGNIAAFVEYTPTPIFNAGTGPEVRPLAVGIVISGL